MKKCLKEIAIAVLLLIFTACSYSNKDYTYPPKQLAEDIMVCFLEEDAELLKGYFSEYIKQLYNVDSQIEEAFNFIEGDIISYDEPFGDESGSSVKDGEWIESKFYGKISNIKTDEDKKYKIIINSFDINKNNPEKVGCFKIIVIDTTTDSESEEIKKCTIGE